MSRDLAGIQNALKSTEKAIAAENIPTVPITREDFQNALTSGIREGEVYIPANTSLEVYNNPQDLKPIYNFSETNGENAKFVVNEVQGKYAKVSTFNQGTGNIISGWVANDPSLWKKASFSSVIAENVERSIADLINRASKFKEKFAKGDYVLVKGFSLNLSVAPSMQIDFEFPK